MDITEVTVIHHAALVLLLLWAAVAAGFTHPFIFLLSLIYLFAVNERCTIRLRRRLQFEERKYASQKRLLCSSESVRWLNHVVEKVWPICMEKIASQQFLLPVIPWFLDKYKPWSARKAEIQHLYLGRSPPMFTDIRVLGESSDDDHLVLELGMSFLSANDMSAILAVQLRKRLGFGISAKLHVTGMHVEGKILVGVKFLRNWPFLGRIRVCFVEPPYFQMTVKPIFNHGLDVTELPGIAGWLDKLLGIAFEQTLVEPNMLVIDMEKFASVPTEKWFNVDERRPIAIAKVEVIEGADIKPSDINGLADPYLKGQLGSYRFRTQIQKNTLSPKWFEEFKIPITSWEVPNMLFIEARDKDPIFDDLLGVCSVNISNLRGGQRYDMWLTLQNVKMGRLHLAVTVVEGEREEGKESIDGEEAESKSSEAGTPRSTPRYHGDSDTLENKKLSDELEPINIEGQDNIGVWVQRPGSYIAQTWEPRKGRGRRADMHIYSKDNESVSNPSSLGDDNDVDKGGSHGAIRRGLHKLSHSFRRKLKQQNRENFTESMLSFHPDIREADKKGVTVKIVLDGKSAGVHDQKTGSSSCSPENGKHSPRKGPSGMAEKIIKKAGKSAHNLKSVLSKKGIKGKEAWDSPHVHHCSASESSNEELRVDCLTVKEATIEIASQPLQ